MIEFICRMIHAGKCYAEVMADFDKAIALDDEREKQYNSK